MADDDTPSGSFPVGDNSDAEQQKVSGASGQKHKVIADIHTGMVLVAPVATPLDAAEEEQEEEDDEAKEKASKDEDGEPPKPLN